MNISAIRHRSTGSDCYALDENTVVLNLWTGHDVDRAYAVSEDPFIHELKKAARLGWRCFTNDAAL